MSDAIRIIIDNKQFRVADLELSYNEQSLYADNQTFDKHINDLAHVQIE
jgi:hypothetical protein